MNVYDLYYELAMENYFVNRKNREYNMSSLDHAPGKNLLFITGLSGGGKSTLAREKAKELEPSMLISLDTIQHNEQLYDGSMELNEGDIYVQNWINKNFGGVHPFRKDGKLDWNEFRSAIEQFIYDVRRFAKTTDKIIIVEGLQLGTYRDFVYSTDPLIVVGTSIRTAAKRATKRDEGKDYFSGKKSYMKFRIDSNKRIDKEIKDLEKKMKRK